MKAISKREHTDVLTALKKLQELHLQGLFLCEPADGFIQHIHSLSERYSLYENLLLQLAECITEYEAMQKDIRVSVVAPALRKARKQKGKGSKTGIMLRQQLATAKRVEKMVATTIK